MSDFFELLAKCEAGLDLTASEAEDLVGQIMSGEVTEAGIKKALLGLRAKGEILAEVVGAASAMRAHAVKLKKPQGQVVVDTCGTGGDGLNTVNISTLAALLVAGAGVPVAKHGNRSITSACGSADVLTALGVKVDANPALVERSLQEANFGFLFAPCFHPAMKVVAPIRKALDVPTIFNLLGPLTNPAGVQHQVVGVADEQKCELYAQALLALGAQRALVVRGNDGQDEISVTGNTDILEINRDKDPEGFTAYALNPETLGIGLYSLDELQGGTPKENAQIAQAVLGGQEGAVRDAAVLNAAATLYVAGAVQEMTAGIQLAAESIDQGKAKNILEQVKEITHVSTG